MATMFYQKPQHDWTDKETQPSNICIKTTNKINTTQNLTSREYK